MTNFEKLKNMTPEQIAAEFMIFRPSDACFDDENRNYYALDGSWHQYSQDCFQANVKWLNEEIPYIKELEAELYHLRHERDQVVKDLLDYEAIGLKPEEIKEILNAVNGGLAAKMEFGVLSVVMLLILISLMEFLLLAVLAAESIHQYRN